MNKLHKDISEWAFSLGAHEDSQDSEVNAKESAMWENPEPRVSCSLYHISSQEFSLFLVRKLLLDHTSIFCSSQSCQASNWPGHHNSVATSVLCASLLSWQHRDREVETKQTLCKCESCSKVTPGILRPLWLTSWTSPANTCFQVLLFSELSLICSSMVTKFKHLQKVSGLCSFSSALLSVFTPHWAWGWMDSSLCQGGHYWER